MEVNEQVMDSEQLWALETALGDVRAEREQVFARRGQQDLPLVPEELIHSIQGARDLVQEVNDRREAAGKITHWEICWEEALESGAETDPVKAYQEHRQAASAHVQAMEQCLRLMHINRKQEEQ